MSSDSFQDALDEELEEMLGNEDCDNTPETDYDDEDGTL